MKKPQYSFRNQSIRSQISSIEKIYLMPIVLAYVFLIATMQSCAFCGDVSRWTTISQDVVSFESVEKVTSAPGCRIDIDLPMPLGKTSRFALEGTSKGHAWIDLGDFSIRVYDAHDDGSLFEPALLHVDVLVDRRREREAIRVYGGLLFTEDGSYRHAGDKYSIDCMIVRDSGSSKWRLFSEVGNNIFMPKKVVSR